MGDAYRVLLKRKSAVVKLKDVVCCEGRKTAEKRSKNGVFELGFLSSYSFLNNLVKIRETEKRNGSNAECGSVESQASV